MATETFLTLVILIIHYQCVQPGNKIGHFLGHGSL